MQDQVTRLRLPGGGALTLRPVEASDEEFLVEVYASTREEELSQVEWPEGRREQFVRWQAAMQRREYESRYPDGEYSVILLDGRPAGRLWVGRDAEQIRLLDIALLPEFQNRGAGTALLGLLTEEARRTGKALRHMIFVLNEDARRFYERLGFEVTEVINGAYLHMEWKGRDKAAPGAGASSSS
ncbi:MAG TPA: GNAT family N-acetyltransferase [Pyrinomonadaceae bacterium]|nr:GNAT family N-acetyltransferase [Pyrinomonadaceae bacterium]